MGKRQLGREARKEGAAGQRRRHAEDREAESEQASRACRSSGWVLTGSASF